ncbi:hypothetical protein D046_3889B, partial [Vibrio parahaemolyticus V-223/04]|jgi:hypothetical protein
MRFC